MLSWRLNQQGSEAGQLCSELPWQKLLAWSLRYLFDTMWKRSQILGMRQFRLKRAHFLVVNGYSYHCLLSGNCFCMLLFGGAYTKGNMHSWMKRNNTEIWLSSLPSAMLLEEENMRRQIDIYICSVKSHCAGQMGIKEIKTLAIAEPFPLLWDLFSCLKASELWVPLS